MHRPTGVPPILDDIAREAGVTRLADLTGLDCLGIPVWQSVRPLSRALSVHQGKGLTDAVARRGAIMEAIESQHAEQWRAPSFEGRWRDLPQATRTRHPDNFGPAAADEALQWTMVEPLSGSAFAIPAAAISLDCVPPFPERIARTSNGLAARFDTDDATLAGLLELIERDATAEWLAQSPIARTGSEIAVDSVDDPGVRDIFDRLAARRIGVRLFQLSPIVKLPVFVAELTDFGARSSLHMHVWGSAAAIDPRTAVRAALLEAVQTRCTEIAGARDTIPLHDAARTGKARPFALPSRPGWSGHAFTADAHGPADLSALVTAIVAAGFDQIGRIILSPPASHAVTVKAFVPGLGYETRRRRR